MLANWEIILGPVPYWAFQEYYVPFPGRGWGSAPQSKKILLKKRQGTVFTQNIQANAQQGKAP